MMIGSLRLPVVIFAILLLFFMYEKKNNSNKNNVVLVVHGFGGVVVQPKRSNSNLVIITSTTTKSQQQQKQHQESMLPWLLQYEQNKYHNFYQSRIRQQYNIQQSRTSTSLFMDGSNTNNANDDDDKTPNEDGAFWASELFKFAQRKGISLSSDDIKYDDDEDDDDEDDVDDDDDDEDEEEINYPQGAINAFLGYDTGNVGDKLAGNVTLTNEKLYSEVKERVLDTAGGFLEYVKGVSDEEEEEDDDDDDATNDKPKQYIVPTTVPDSELTAGEVIIQVLDSLLHNDVPTKNKGVEILFGYSSVGSQIKNEIGLTVSEYADFLKETEYKVLFNHNGIVTIDKADYSFDGKKAYFTARLKTGPTPLETTSVNFILSTTGVDDDACWLIDSFLIRPQSMRRRRRK